MFSDDEQKQINDMIKAIGTISISIIDAISESQTHSIDNVEDDTEDNINKMNMDRVIKVVEFEEMYNNLFKSNLSRLSR